MPDTTIAIRQVGKEQETKIFIHLPAQLYQNSGRWVPPIYADEYAFHNPKKNPAFEQATVARWIAYRNNVPVGRIMGIIHHTHNTLKNEKTARFYQLDCIDDQEVATQLLKMVEQWAREQGMNMIIGPFGFSDKDPQGVQVEGLEYLPVIATPVNPDYLPGLIEYEGYRKHIDCVSYYIPIPKQLPEIYERIANRAALNKKARLLEFSSRKALKPYVLPVFQLVNETYSTLFGFIPMSEDEIKKMASQYLPVLNPSFVKVMVDEQNEVLSFVVAMPDMSKGLQKAKGKLFPFGFIHILMAMSKSKQLNLLLGAVKEGYRGKGLDVLMGIALLRSAAAKRMTEMDSHLILENNTSMRAECEKLGGRVYKRFRVYEKLLKG